MARNLRGRCEHCGVEYPTVDLAGYNVRRGAVVRALCYSCCAMWSEGMGRDDWFERLMGRVRRAKAQAQYRARSRDKFKQMRMEV